MLYVELHIHYRDKSQLFVYVLKIINILTALMYSKSTYRMFRNVLGSISVWNEFSYNLFTTLSHLSVYFPVVFMCAAGFIIVWDRLSVVFSQPLDLLLVRGLKRDRESICPITSPLPLSLLSLCLGCSIKVSEGSVWVLCLLVNYGYCSQGTPERGRWVCSWKQDERKRKTEGGKKRGQSEGS